MENGIASLLKITFPNKLWIGEVSRKYPYYEFEIQSFIPINQDPLIGNSLISITGTDPSQILEDIKTHKSLKSYFVMSESGSNLTLNTQTKDNFLLKSIIENAIIIQFPIKVLNGIGTFEINGSRNRIDKFIDQLSEKGLNVEIKSIGHFEDDVNENQLTDRQLFIYNKAKEAGYYDSPRKITLTDLAKQLDVAKSSLSSMLQRIHKKLLG